MNYMRHCWKQGTTFWKFK